MRILILGLDGAGKTTILYRLQVGEVVTTIPSMYCFAQFHLSIYLISLHMVLNSKTCCVRLDKHKQLVRSTFLIDRHCLTEERHSSWEGTRLTGSKSTNLIASLHWHVFFMWFVWSYFTATDGPNRPAVANYGISIIIRWTCKHVVVVCGQVS